ncbi:MAG: Stp1/IreP family PP2C-type Ser/Thr phosphatase [Oscillospiraceae bacterium]|nr:Stp1/IreP family PP2C-type Ser/Thr phosphatase [Oscillospiraceae bacterium]
MNSWGITDSGKVRQNNQDVFKIVTDEEKEVTILVVCDGMGGANAGNVASELAAEVFAKHVSEHIKADTILDDLAEIVADASVAANTAVFDKGLYEEECSGMGTTLTALVSSKDGEVVANIGDSRAYHITPLGISQITKDHSVVEEMIDRGEITRDEANKHPSKNLITRVIGANMYEITDIFTQNTDAGDIILLCSDGLSNLVSEDEMLSELQNCTNIRESCEALLELSLSRGAPDNVTVAVFKK